MKYEIEKGVALPPSGIRSDWRYPFGEMEIGDSFYVPASVRIGSVRSAGVQWRHRHDRERKFSVRRTSDGGTRVWRTA